MKHCKEILHLLHAGTTIRSISATLHVSTKSIQQIINAAREKDIGWDKLYDMTEDEINEILFPKKQSTNTEVDFNLNHIVLLKTAKESWERYCDNQLLTGHEPIGYSMFCKYMKKQKMKVKDYKSDFFPGVGVFCLSLPEKAETETRSFHICFIMLPYSHYVSLSVMEGNETVAWCKACAAFFNRIGGVTSTIYAIPGKTVIWGNEVRMPVQNICLQFKTVLYTDNKLKSLAKTVSETLQKSLNGHSFYDHNNLQEELDRICAEYNTQGTPAPYDVYRLLEARHLSPLPEKREYIWGTVKAGFDCHVQVDNVLYSVPYEFCQKSITVKFIGNQVEFFSDDNGLLIATHNLHTNPESHPFYVTNADHLPPPDAKIAWDRNRILDYAYDKGGPHLRNFVSELLSQYIYEQQAYRRCLSIISLATRYGKSATNEACRQLLAEHKYPAYTNLKRCLERMKK